MTDKDNITALSLGTRLRGTQPDQYELIEELGAGGFAITYKAYDRVFKQEVAIKEYFPNILAARCADGVTVSPRSSNEKEDYEWGLQRFLQEARTLAEFSDELNIVNVVGFVEDNGTAYIIMNYVSGISLDQFLTKLEAQGRRISEKELTLIMIPILDSLRAVHEADYLHQDIKPANIYIRHDGRPILLDFGGARKALGDHSRSVSRVLTDGYAPHEQYSGKLSAATDLYAVGATMYRCIMGAAPLSSLARSSASAEGEKDPLLKLSDVRPGGYSAELLQIIDKLLNLRAVDRPQSAASVTMQLLGITEVEEKIPEPKPREPEPSELPHPVSPVAPGPESSLGERKSKGFGFAWSVVFLAVAGLGYYLFKYQLKVEILAPEEMVVVPSGCFEMGSDDGERDAMPVHHVCITQDFEIGKYEVTIGLWRKVMGNDLPSFAANEKCDHNDCPVAYATSTQVHEFVKKLNQLTGNNYRLPTEAEWEYACRSGGENQKYCGGDDLGELAWHQGNSDHQFHPVGKKQPNGLGLYDMSGNAGEWVSDWYNSDYYKVSPTDDPTGPTKGSYRYRVFRGGSWADGAEYSRSTFRRGGLITARGVASGFRLARTL